MSDLARTSVFRGMRTMRSSGPQPAVGGSIPAASVMSAPITAKSPSASSKMSGQPEQPTDFAPFSCGSEPSLRRNMGCAFILHNNRGSAGNMQEQNTSYSWFYVGWIRLPCRLWQNAFRIVNHWPRPFAIIGKRRK